MFKVVGEFIVENSPCELVMLVLHFLPVLDIAEGIARTSQTMKDFAEMWLKDRRINEESVICEVMENNPVVFSTFLDLLAFDHDFLIEKAYSIYLEGLLYQRSRKREEVRDDNDVFGDYDLCMDDDASYRQPEYRYLETEEEYNEYQKKFKMKRKSLLHLVSKCCCSQKSEKFFERHVLFPFLNHYDPYSGYFHLEIVYSILKNPSVDLFCYNYLSLRMLFVNPRYDTHTFEKAITALLSHPTQKPDPKKIFYCEGPPLCSGQSPKQRISSFPVELCRECCPKEQPKNPDSLRSWYEVVNDAELNFRIFNNQLLTDWIYTPQYSTNFGFFAKSIMVWDFLNLDFKFLRKTTLIFGRCKTPKPHDLMEIIMKRCQIVDLDKWITQPCPRFDRTRRRFIEPDEEDYVPSLYTISSSRSSYVRQITQVLLDHGHPLTLGDLAGAKPGQSLPKLLRLKHLLPKNWSKDDNLVPGILYKIFDRHEGKPFPIIDSLSTFFEAVQHDDSRNNNMLKRHKIFFWSIISKQFEQNLVVKEVSRKYKKKKKKKKKKKIISQNNREPSWMITSYIKLFTFLKKNGLPVDFEVMKFVARTNSQNLISYVMTQNGEDSLRIQQDLRRPENREVLENLYEKSLRMFKKNTSSESESGINTLKKSFGWIGDYLDEDTAKKPMNYLCFIILAIFCSEGSVQLIKKENRTLGRIFGGCEGEMNLQLNRDLGVCVSMNVHAAWYGWKRCFCKDCKLVVCVSCVKRCHRGHKVVVPIMEGEDNHGWVAKQTKKKKKRKKKKVVKGNKKWDEVKGCQCGVVEKSNQDGEMEICCRRKNEVFSWADIL